MRYIFFLALGIISTIIVSAQNFDIKISAGADATQMKNFNNGFTIIQGIPFKTGNELPQKTPVVSKIEGASSQTNYKVGFFADAEISKEFWNHWKLSISLGVNQLAYTYDTKLPANNLFEKDTMMKQISNDFGDTKLLYINSRFLNVSKSFGRVSLQLGPVVNYLVHKKYNADFSIIDSVNSVSHVISEQRGNPKKLKLGGHLNLRYKILTPLEIMIGTQYFFNSIYESAGTYEGVYKKSNPIQLQLGLSYRIAYF
ncbi:MAG TPA: hypothetical protein PK110_05295 [Niabella sp.]|jgi:hypothetical protein|nr:hypothetical protein [Chitinophagaceae bacterium]HRN48356.1 hypothetical protein [Niabella sp.]HRO84220.1 hypothetical protein [Niabella sp.]HUN04291.1 hypothetical protein [Niabella sp.]